MMELWSIFLENGLTQADKVPQKTWTIPPILEKYPCESLKRRKKFGCLVNKWWGRAGSGVKRDVTREGKNVWGEKSV